MWRTPGPCCGREPARILGFGRELGRREHRAHLPRAREAELRVGREQELQRGRRGPRAGRRSRPARRPAPTPRRRVRAYHCSMRSRCTSRETMISSSVATAVASPPRSTATAATSCASPVLPAVGTEVRRGRCARTARPTSSSGVAITRLPCASAPCARPLRSGRQIVECNSILRPPRQQGGTDGAAEALTRASAQCYSQWCWRSASG